MVGLGSAAAVSAVCWPLDVHAQAAPTIGYLSGSLGFGKNLVAFRTALAEANYVEGRNLTVHYRSADSQTKWQEFAADLVRRRVDLMLVSGINAARAAKAQTESVPTVFVVGEDPVKEGLVASLSRPGGQITGISYFTNQLYGKRLGLLKEIVPHATAFALILNPDNLNAEPDSRETRIAATALGLGLEVVPVARERDLNAAFEKIMAHKIGGIVVVADSLLLDNRAQVAALAARHALPVIYDRREFSAGGGLMSYGADPAEAYRLAGLYAARILKGERPADLPVQQSTRFEFIINLGVAKALGLTIPETLLATADEVIP
jgi:putative tryptophan/tyrosine transport system substrate-binding protein